MGLPLPEMCGALQGPSRRAVLVTANDKMVGCRRPPISHGAADSTTDDSIMTAEPFTNELLVFNWWPVYLELVVELGSNLSCGRKESPRQSSEPHYYYYIYKP